MDISGDIRLAVKLLTAPLMRYGTVAEFPVATAHAWALSYNQSVNRQAWPDQCEDRCRMCGSDDVLISTDSDTWTCRFCGSRGTNKSVRLVIRDSLGTQYAIDTVDGELDKTGAIVITIDIH